MTRRDWHLWRLLRDGGLHVPEPPSAETMTHGMGPDTTEQDRARERYGVPPTVEELKVIRWKQGQSPPLALTFREAMVAQHGVGHDELIDHRCSLCGECHPRPEGGYWCGR